MTLVACWLAFPVLLVAICLGCGLLLERATGRRLAGALLVPAGIAVVIVTAQIATAADATAELATPAVVALAAAGLLVGRRRIGRPDLHALAAAAGVFAVYLAPVVASGEATFAGYVKLDDTATWFALVDRAIEHGRSVDGLAPSTYEATLDLNLAAGYPLGAFLPLGVGRALVGQDVAWVFQPYVAVLAAALALTLYGIARPLVVSPALRAGLAFVGGQAALLLGYSLWGGVKEVMAALLVALAAALVAPHSRPRPGAGPRAMLAPAVVVTATVSTLSPAGAVVWLGPMIAVALIVSMIPSGTTPAGAVAARARRAARLSAPRWLALAALVAVLSAPWILGAGWTPPTSAPLTDDAARGNLVGPLNPLQIAGVWPAADFRVDPGSLALTYLLIATALALAAVGLALAWRRRAAEPLLYCGGAAAAALVTLALGSPWVAAKGLAIASPAPLLAALAGAAATVETRSLRVALAPSLAAAAVVGGVLWSNALAVDGASLAPRDRLAELERIGERIAGRGPALMTEYEPYGVRHFLREADPEGASELRRRRVPLRDRSVVPAGESVAVGELSPAAVRAYRTLVLRRPTGPPPEPFRIAWRGEDYEVWQRPP